MELTKEEKERYSRHLLLDGFGEDAQIKLKKSSVLVVGAGGLGSPCLLYLAAAGVGHLCVADDDVVSFSNLQRQVLYDSNDVGKMKCEIAKEKILAKNPHVKVTLVHDKITADNALATLKEFDVIVDGTDNFATRYLLNDACVILGKPLVYGALYKFEGQVSCFNYNNGPTYRCLFPDPPAAGAVLGCAETGVIGVLPGIIGTWQATEAIKIITGLGTPLSGKLLMMNVLSNDISVMSFKAVAANKLIKQLGEYDAASCSIDAAIDGKTLVKWMAEGDIQLIDVREEDEFERSNIGGVNIPYSEFEENMHIIDPKKLTVVVCQTGARSRNAIRILQDRFQSMRVFNLEKGLSSM